MTDRKKILYIASRVPFPPNKGDKIRTFRCIDHLASRHDVYAACFVDGSEDHAHVESLRQWCADVLAIPRPPRLTPRRAAAAFLRGRSLSLAAHECPALLAAIRRWADQHHFDAAIAFSAFMAPYAVAAQARRTILDLCDCDSEKWRAYAMHSRWPISAFWRTEARRLRQFEDQCLWNSDATLVINERERAVLDPSGRLPMLHVVPNGVEMPTAVPPPPSRVGPVVAFIGAMDYRPNVDGVAWFAKNVWPRVAREVPGAEFLIAGRNPTAQVRALKDIHGVTVLGEIASVEEVLPRTRVFVAPLRMARGMQNKVLEAMAHRRPVVATRAVADGLLPAHGQRLIVEDQPIPFADRVVQLLHHSRRTDEIADNGYRYVAAFHNWTEKLRAYERLVLGEAAAAPESNSRTWVDPMNPIESTAQELRFESRLEGLADVLTGEAAEVIATSVETRTSRRRSAARPPAETVPASA